VSAQALEALEAANRVRTGQMRLRHAIHALPPAEGVDLVEVLLRSGDELAGSMTVERLVTAIRRVGPRKATMILRHAGIVSGGRKVRDLTERQVGGLIAALRNLAARW
jgi:hypothetical protein